MKTLDCATDGRARMLLAVGFGVFFAVLYSFPIRELVLFVLHPENRKYHSHIVFIPLVSGYLLLERRKEIAGQQSFSAHVGVPLLLAALALYLLGGSERFVSGGTNRISLQMGSAVVFAVGGFIAIYGIPAFRHARFALLFLLFVAPMPTGIMEGILHFLQVCSTEVSYLLFKLSGVPIYREGFVFTLPGLSIEIAKACAGMRATVTLFIVTVLAGHLFLRSMRGKALLALSTFPITIVGNSLRIFGLTLLGLYVDRAYIDSTSLPHLRGGWLFFLVDLVIAAGVLAVLRRGERSG